MATALLLVAVLAAPASAQLGEACTASVLNRSVQVEEDGAFFIADLPAEPGFFRIRVSCEPEGGDVVLGESPIFQFVPNGLVEIEAINFGEVSPIPVGLELVVPGTQLTEEGQTLELRVDGVLGDGSTVDLTDPETGTEYWSSSERLATVTFDENSGMAFITALERGRVLIAARNQGVLGSIEIEILIPNDADGDGLTDEFEEALGLDPNNPDDALEDPDLDNLGNLEEFELGTDIYADDTDGDGLLDGEESERFGTDPTNPDTDGDGLLDGLELGLGANPFAPDTDEDGITDGLEVDLGTDPLVPDATTQVRGRVIQDDGTLVSGGAVIAFSRLTAVTDIGGAFVIDNVPASLGAIQVFARFITADRVFDGVSPPVAAAAGDVTDVGEIVVREMNGRVSGRVLDPDGLPVPRAWVVLRGGTEIREVNTDVTGVFVIDRLPPGPVELRAVDPLTGLRGRAGEILTDDAELVVDIQLGAFGTVFGEVLGRDAETPAGPGVIVEAKIGGTVVATTLSDELSRYRFDFLPLGNYRIESSDSAGNRGRALVALEETSQVVDAPVAFLGRGTVFVTVVTSAGDRVTDAAVTVLSLGLFAQQFSALTGPSGALVFEGVFQGVFEAGTRGAFPKRGEIVSEGDTDSVTLVIPVGGGPAAEPAGATVVGRVFEADGVTPVPGAAVRMLTSSGTADGAGLYELEQVSPLSPDIRAEHPATTDCVEDFVPGLAADVTVSKDLVLRGRGDVGVTVRYGDGEPVPNAEVELFQPSPPLPVCRDERRAKTGSEGTFAFPDFPRGNVGIRATGPFGGLRGGVTTTLQNGESLELTVFLEPHGTVTGRVFESDGATPIPGILVRLRGGGIRQDRRSDGEGRFTFRFVKVGGSPFTLEVVDGSENRLGRETGVTLSEQGEIAERDVVIVERGTVTGRVTDPAGLPVPNLRVKVGTSFSGFRDQFPRTDADGVYKVDGIPIGNIQVEAKDTTRRLEGKNEGPLTFEGEVLTLDIQLDGDQILARLFDANNHVYPVQFPSGSIVQGSLGVFRLSEDAQRGGVQLEIGQGGIFRRFVGTSNFLDQDGREVVLTGVDASGLEVVRKVFVPADGYFARFVEIFANPTAEPITVDVGLSSFYRYVRNTRNGRNFQDPPTIANTSSGDTDLVMGAGENPDRWVVLDVELTERPHFDAVFPELAHVFDGEGGSLAVSRAFYEFNPSELFTHLRATWESVTVPPGEAVALLHFTAQQLGVAGANASAERLSQLPPEALEGLDEAEVAAIQNFVVPAGAVSELEPLPPLDGRVEGLVLEGDLETVVPGAEVRWRSDNPLFGRRLDLRADNAGRYRVTSTATSNGGRTVVPRDAYTVDATNVITRVFSPPYVGGFGADELSVQDVIFTETATVTGTVRRDDGNVVSEGAVTLRGRQLLINLQQPIPTDGMFTFLGLPPEVYSLVAAQPHPQGDPLVGATSAVVDEGGETVLSDITMPPTGGVDGLVRFGDGLVVVNQAIVLRRRDGSGFDRFTVTDTGGLYRFLDVPVGDYTLRIVDPSNLLPTVVEVTILAEEVLRRDIQFLGAGTVEVVATFSGDGPLAGTPVPDAEVFLRQQAFGTGFLRAGRTGPDGRLRIDEVVVGETEVRVEHPQNDELRASTIDVLVNDGDLLVMPVGVPIDNPPQVEILLPFDGAQFLEGSAVTITADASDDFGVKRVDFFADGVLVASDDRLPYTVSVALPASAGETVAITAMAVDNVPNVTVSASRQVQITGDLIAPTVDLFRPSAGDSRIEGTSVRFEATAADNVAVERVEFRAGGVPVATIETPPYRVDFAIPADFAAAGPTPLAVSATAFDPGGNATTDSVTFTVVPDEPPTITLVEAPTDGTQVIEGQLVRFRASASDDRDVSVDLQVDGELTMSRDNPIFSFDLTVPPPPADGSPITVTLVARDNAGQITAAPAVTLEVVDDASPTVSFLEPVEGTEVREGEIFTMRADATDDLEVVQVEFFVDGALVEVDSVPPYETEVRLDPGDDLSDVVLLARVFDGIGQSGEAEVAIVRREDGQVPDLDLVAPADGSILSAGPSDVVLVIDASFDARDPAGADFDGDGAEDTEFQAQIFAARQVLAQLNPEVSRVALVMFQSNAALLQELTADFAAVQAALDDLALQTPFGDADYESGIERALDELVGPRARRPAEAVVLFFSAGGGALPAAALERAADGGIPVNVLAPGANASTGVLADVAALTGGALATAVDADELANELPLLLLFTLDLLRLEALASDDVEVRDVSFRVTAEDGSVDATVVDDFAPYVSVLDLPQIDQAFQVEVRASARDFAGNQSEAGPATVNVVPEDTPPVILRLDPPVGLPGDTVRVLGNFFDPLAAFNAVSFNGVFVLGESGSKIEVVVTVPPEATSGPLTVRADSLTSAPVIFQLDADRDGLGELDEAAAGTDPNNPDSDGDGLLDGEEVELGTDPNDVDSDGDGLGDAFEVENGLDPLDGGDAGLDPDGDGLDNLSEQSFGTDPRDADSDDDGLEDGFEVNFVGTDPAEADTDGGGRSDGEEVNEDFTDPLDPADDIGGVMLPTTLFDGGGFPWPVQQDGRIVNDNLGTFSTGFDLRIDNRSFPNFELAGDDESARELVIGPWEHETGLLVRRKLLVPETAAFARYLEILENPTAEEVTVEVQLFSNLWARSQTQLVATSSGDALAGLDDFWLVLDDFSDGAGRPVAVTVFGAPFAPVRPSEVFVAPLAGNFLTNFEVTVPAGERRILLHFGAQRDERAAGQAAAEELRRLVGEALADFAPAERADVINFVAFPDTDGDGLGDDEELALGSDPNNPDSDGDGAGDGWEAFFGFDPTDPADGAADPDGDGLGNFEEEAAGTDPNVADSDGDGVTDGDEVNVHGSDPTLVDSDGDGLSDGDEVNVHGSDPTLADTDGGGKDDGQEIADGSDPLDPTDDGVPLPITLFDGSNFRWDVQRNGRIASGSAGAFSSGPRLRVEGAFFPNFLEALVEDGARELTLGPWLPGGTLDGLRVSRKIFVPDDDALVRYLEIFENTTGELIELDAGWDSDLASDSQTQVIVTSTGDPLLGTGDRWIITDDIDGSGDPTMVQAFAGRAARLRPAEAVTNAPGGDDVMVTWHLLIPPGERLILMHFASQNGNVSGALTSAGRLDDLLGSTVAGLAESERDEIVNFFAFPDADFDGLSDDDEAALGTDPAVVDTDGDGLLDGFEARHGLDPLDPSDAVADPDGDGLDNLGEQDALTDPNNADSDFDGAGDGAEVTAGSDPLRSDTDGDGLGDGEEINVHGTDPTVVDTDGGGRSDFDEVAVDLTDPLDPSDDRPPVLLPTTLVDGEGFNWDILRNGTIGEGDQAFLQSFALVVNSRVFPNFSEALVDASGRELTLGPWSIEEGLVITRRVRVPDDAGWVRYLEILENPTLSDIEVPVSFNFRARSFGTGVVATSRGFAAYTELDTWQVVDDLQDGGSVPAIVGVDGDGLAARPSNIFTSAGRYLSNTNFPVTVPARGRVVLMHFGAQRALRAEATALAESLVRLEGGVLDGMTPELQGDVLNFLFGDGDRDGLTDDEEATLGTDPSNPDSDGDGLRDGYEVGRGSDPLVGGDGALDPDGDGLDNVGEQNAGSDPGVADTDGDGLDDGREVQVLGSDPAFADSDRGGRDDFDEWVQGGALGDSSDDGSSGSLPVVFTDQGGFRWDVQRDGRILDGTNNSFDGGYEIAVDGGLIPDLSTSFRTSREAVVGPWETAGLEIWRRVYVPTSDTFARFLEVLYNPTASDVTVELSLRTDLGANFRTAVLATSSGDLLLGAEDDWLITRNTLSSSIPKVVHLYAGDGGVVFPSSASRSRDLVDVDFDLTVPAGERVLLLHYAAQIATDAEALDRVATLADFSGSALDLFERHVQEDVVNLFAFVDSDGDLLPDSDEIAAGTDPNNPDTDGDGAGDGFEVAFGLDPLDPADGALDLDADGLDNAGESAAGSDPTNPDTDGDGLTDGDEVNVHGSSPVLTDSDGDRLGDFDEVTIFGTDPASPDSDGGGRRDGDEIEIDGTDPLDGTDDAVSIKLNNDLERAESPAVTSDRDGNVHVVWTGHLGTFCHGLFYSMVRKNGDVLIDDTPLTDACEFPGGMALATDSDGRVHVTWEGDSVTDEVFHLVVDPSRDDRDGSSSDAATLITVEPRILSLDDGVFSNEPTVAVDGDDALHVVWRDQVSTFDNLRYSKIAADGEILISRRTIPGGISNPDLAIDADGNVHVVVRGSEGSSFGLSYFVLDGATGDVLTDATVIAAAGSSTSFLGTIRIDPGTGLATVFYQDRVDGTSISELFYLRLDPTADDRDGSAGDPAALVVVPPTQLTPSDGRSSSFPNFGFDDSGRLMLAYFEPGEDGFTDVVGRVLENDFSGALALRVLSGDAEARPQFILDLAVAGRTAAVVWTDRRAAEEQVRLAFLNPDADADGLPNLDEGALGTSVQNPDSDGDGMGDGFEADHGLDPLDPSDASLDPDGDGLSNLGEHDAGSDPDDPDSDGDGLTDGDEVNFHQTDPTAADSDRDGLTDGDEVQVHGTDPTDADTDGDLYPDGYEVDNGFDPLDPADGNFDSDGDGLTDGGEFVAGTDRFDPDSDDDGLADGAEVQVHGTDPLDVDSDGDELGDGAEVLDAGTDPLGPDTDAGGRGDGGEVLFDGTDPLDPADDVVPVVVSQSEALQTRMAADGDGNLHLVWSDAFLCGGVFYTMLSPARETLIDETQVVGSTCDIGVVEVATDPLGRVHLAWAESSFLNYLALDPSLDDQDGTAADPAVITVTPQTFPSIDASDFSFNFGLRLVADGSGGAHLAWARQSDRQEGFTTDLFFEVRYLRVDAAGNVASPERVVFTSVPFDTFGGDFLHGEEDGYGKGFFGGTADELSGQIVPHMTIGRDGDVHLVAVLDRDLEVPGGIAEPGGGGGDGGPIGLQTGGRKVRGSEKAPRRPAGHAEKDHGGGFCGNPFDFGDGEGGEEGVPGTPANECGLYYALLDGVSGEPLIDATRLVPSADGHAAWPSVLEGPGENLTVVYQDGGEVAEVRSFRIDPFLDDRDGDAADPAVLRVSADTLLTPDDGASSRQPQAALDAFGNLYLLTHERSPESFLEIDIWARGFTAAGGELFPRQKLAGGLPAGNPGDDSFGTPPGFAVVSPSIFASWTRFNEVEFVTEVLVGVVNPDRDRDGLANREEPAAGTDLDNPDTDGDAMLDGYEVRFGLDPLDPGDAGLDPDGDGLSNLEEQSSGTDPLAFDTDGDGLGDGAEINVHGTDPGRSDSDGDGLTDGDEVDVHGTDPLAADSDGDGLPDGYEVSSGLDPLDPGDAGLDPDGDGLTSLDEFGLGTDPSVADSDGDGLTDGDEVNLHGTDPLDPDGDDDRLSDGDEVGVHGTDPLSPDTDGDSRDDWREVAVDATDPVDALDRWQPIALNTGSGEGFRPAMAMDAGGNVHVTWVDDRLSSRPIFYGMLDSDGNVLIGNTQLTSTSGFKDDPDLAIDGDGHVHVVWEDFRDGTLEVYHLEIDPAADDQNGSAGSFINLVLVAPHRLSTTVGTSASSRPSAVADERGHLHLTWWESLPERRLHYGQVDDAGTMVVGPAPVHAGGISGVPETTADMLIDGSGVHIVWQDWDGFSDLEVHYALYDPVTGTPLIAATALTPSDDIQSGSPSLSQAPDGQLVVAYHHGDGFTTAGAFEIFMARFDPTLDDRDGSAADPAQIIVSPEVRVTEDDGIESSSPTIAVDDLGNVHVAYQGNFLFGDADVVYRVVDAGGNEVIPPLLLSEEHNASFPRDLETIGMTAYLVWENFDNGFDSQPQLAIVNPDGDGDGLSNFEEYLLSTDPAVADTDGGGAGDGQEVLVDGTDPLDPSDDLP